MSRQGTGRTHAGATTPSKVANLTIAFAAVLYKIVRSAAVSSALTSIITSALHAL